MKVRHPSRACGRGRTSASTPKRFPISPRRSWLRLRRSRNATVCPSRADPSPRRPARLIKRCRNLDSTCSTHTRGPLRERAEPTGRVNRRAQRPGFDVAMLLSGKSAIVTGDGRGIGRGITDKLLEAGARVLVAQRQDLPNDSSRLGSSLSCGSARAAVARWSFSPPTRLPSSLDRCLSSTADARKATSTLLQSLGHRQSADVRAKVLSRCLRLVRWTSRNVLPP